MPKKITQAEAEKKVQEKCNIKNVRSSTFTYAGCYTIIELTCNECNHTWKMDYNQWVSYKTGCKKCGIKRQRAILGNKLAISEEEAHNQLQSRIKDKNLTCSPYVFTRASLTRLELTCNNCLYSWGNDLKSFLKNNTGCPVCSGVANTQEIAERKVLEVCKNKNYTYTPFEYKNNRTMIAVQCKQCQKKFSQQFHRLVNGKAGCSYCAVAGFDRTKKGYLYLNAIKREDTIIGYKIGITHNLLKRLSQQRRKSPSTTTENMFLWECEIGEHILVLEKSIKMEFSFMGYLSKHLYEDGYTETFPPNKLAIVMTYIDSVVEEHNMAQSIKIKAKE